MTGSLLSRRMLLVLPFLLIFACALFTIADAQNVPASLSPGNPLNDCGCPRGSDTIPLSSGMLGAYLPKIPNLELGFLYSFGNNVRTGRFTADYVLPFKLSADSVLFGEAHAEGWNFWKKPSVHPAAEPPFPVTTSVRTSRVDLSFGGGYRTMLGANALLGVNGFFDTSHLFDRWHSSGGAGLEMAANVGGDGAIDLNLNWYGNLLFDRDVLVSYFRNKHNNFDVEAGYSHALFNQALDLRLKLVVYQFDTGTAVNGGRVGADLTTRDGMFTVRYEHGHDRIQSSYDTIGGFVTVGLQLENLLSGESPFRLPEPVFKSPRDLRRFLGLKVKRNWHHPDEVVLARGPCTLPGSALRREIINKNTLYTTSPLIPTITTLAALFCWCDALGDHDVQADLRDFVSEYRTDGANVHISKGSGCTRISLIKTGFFGPPNDISLNGLGPPLMFSPGGGVSVLVNQ
jgi:hypothetical protein